MNTQAAIAETIETDLTVPEMSRADIARIPVEDRGKLINKEITVSDFLNPSVKEPEKSKEKPEAEEAGKENVGEEKPEETPEKEPEKEASKEEGKAEFDTEKYKDMSNADLIKEIEKQQKSHLADQKMIGRQSTELGNLRKAKTESDAKIAEFKAAKKPDAEEIKELFEEDPAKGVAAINSNKDIENKQKLEEITNRALETQMAVMEKMPDFEDMIDDMCGLLKDDGIDAKVISDFKQYPYVADSATLFQLAQRARTVKDNLKLKLELETLKKQTNNVEKKIQETGKKGPALSNKAGSGYTESSDTPDLTRAEIAKMKPDERSEMLKELAKKKKEE